MSSIIVAKMKSKNKSYKKEDVMRFWPPCICMSEGGQ